MGSDNGRGSGREIRHTEHDHILQTRAQLARGESSDASRFPEQVYDLVNAGPQHRFMIRRPDGRPLLVHNCIQAISACLLTAAMRRIEDAGIPVIASIHDEVVSECEDAPDRFDEFHQLMEVVPAWASGCYISAESHVARRYGK